jgi:uncharacterized caspase-like protein
MIPFRSILFAAAFLVATSISAYADKRVALVIGNSDYQNVAKLTNPANDASAIASMFKAAGFDSVVSKLNLPVNEMRRALRDFGNKSRDADVAVLYYAGHGIELDGTNYLIPVDASLETDADVMDEALALDRVLFAVEPAKKLRLIILDACRDNPFVRTMKRTIASRAVGRGLAKVEPSSPNTMIAFAAKAGSTASDGDTKNSPFAVALVEHLPKPGLDLRKAFGFVRDDVLKSTGNKQEPYVYGSLGGDDVPLVPAKPVAAAPQSDSQASVRRDYELAMQAGDREAWEAFLQTYHDGFYANLAKVQLKKIAAEEVRASAAEKARQAEQEKARLIAEGAKQAEQAKAASASKAAEQERLATEKVKQIQLTKAAAAEKARADTENAAAQKALEENKKADAVAVETQAKQSVDKQTVENQKLASVSPPPDIALPPTELVTSVQFELRRVGCLGTLPNGEWGIASQRSLTLFNRYAGTKFDVKLATIDAFDAIKAKPSRVCPLTCDHGFKVDGDRCAKITCREGYEVGDNNTCERSEAKKPPTNARRSSRDMSERAAVEGSPSKPQASGQVLCNNQGCRPVAKGCRIEWSSNPTGKSTSNQFEKCN